jgi:hypothetical protein
MNVTFARDWDGYVGGYGTQGKPEDLREEKD